MANAQEIPQLASELVEMSREYLRQETLEPAKQLGVQAGLGIGGAILLAIGAVCLAWAFYYGVQLLVPETAWWVVFARGMTVIASGVAAAIVGGSRERVAPVVMTAVTAGLALLPFAFAGNIAGLELVHPMAVVVAAGLITSAVLNLFVVPALYLRYGGARPEPDAPSP